MGALKKLRTAGGAIWNSRAFGIGSLVVVGLAVAITVAMVIMVTFFPHKNVADPAPTSSPRPTATPSAAANATDGAGCHVPVGDTSRNPAPPADLRWEAHNGFTWPASRSAGPTVLNADTVGICFAHSPLGAALAATTIGSAIQAGVSAHAVAEAYTLDSPGKTLLLQRAPSTVEPLPAGIALAGFSVDSYTSAEAVVSIVLTAPGTTTGFASTSMTLRWVDGDWKVRPLDDGTLAPAGINQPTEDGFTKWATR